ncbi:MAG: complex I NDUFA9 subunit family protein [Acetobacteraceae bacterium]|nr:complex I NDUFA9 subunit family protein [Acetobacteraceae bacterium]
MVAEERRVATVFGGSGFIGRYIVKRLAQRGFIVRVGVRDPDRANFLKPMGALGQIVPMAASVREEAAVSALVAGAQVVINCVGILYETGSQTFQALHAEAPGRIGRAAAAAGAKHVVHVSAIGADAASPSVYARTKAEGEAALRAVFPEAVVLRPSIVFGPEDNFFNQFAALAQVLPALPLFGGGTTRFQPVYVGDVADAAMAALDRAEAAGKTYELGGPRVYSFREILEFILRTTGRRRFLLPVPYCGGGAAGASVRTPAQAAADARPAPSSAARQRGLARRTDSRRSRHHTEGGGGDRAHLSCALSPRGAAGAGAGMKGPKRTDRLCVGSPASTECVRTWARPCHEGPKRT